MGKIKLFITTSLDQKIADEYDSLSWLENQPPISDEHFTFEEFYESIGATLMGARTFKAILRSGLGVLFPGKENYVLTNSIPNKSFLDEQYISGDIIQQLTELKLMYKKDIWLVGGGITTTYLIENNLVDELYIGILPMMLGKGVSLFPGGNLCQKKFDLIFYRAYDGGSILLCYRPLD